MLDHFKKLSGVQSIGQESKLQLYLLLANSRCSAQKSIAYKPRLPEFIYIQQSNSLINYMFATSDFEQNGALYTPGSNIIKEALDLISQKMDDQWYETGSFRSEVSIIDNDFVEKRNMYWLTRKGTNFIIYLDMEIIFGEDYKINPEKYGEADLILPLYQSAKRYEIAPNLKLANELKKAYNLMGFNMMAAEIEKKAQRPKRYCVIV